MKPDIKLEASAIAMQGHIGGSSSNGNKGTESDPTRLSFKLARWRPADSVEADGEEDALPVGTEGKKGSQLDELVADWDNDPPGAPIQQKKEDVEMRDRIVPPKEPMIEVVEEPFESKETTLEKSTEPIETESTDLIDTESKEAREELTQAQPQLIPLHSDIEQLIDQPLAPDISSVSMEEELPLQGDEADTLSQVVDNAQN